MFGFDSKVFFGIPYQKKGEKQKTKKDKPKMLKNKKTHCVFCFFDILIDHIQNKTKQCFLFNFKTKNLGNTKKNNLLSQNQAFSQKFCFLFFLVLLEFVLKVSRFCLLFSMWPKTRMVVGIIGCMTG